MRASAALIFPVATREATEMAAACANDYARQRGGDDNAEPFSKMFAQHGRRSYYEDNAAAKSNAFGEIKGSSRLRFAFGLFTHGKEREHASIGGSGNSCINKRD